MTGAVVDADRDGGDCWLGPGFEMWSGEFESREQPRRARFGSEVWFVSCGTATGWLFIGRRWI